MEREEIKHYLKDVIEEILEIQYGDDLFSQELTNLSFNSISFIKLIVKLETEFDITFGEEITLLQKNTTVYDIVNAIYANTIENNENLLEDK
ncbi:hypothetical protein acsn021_17370 [Anaerocolumna cellulosilytica]|uniref:Uncharacterized protein n=1 Tax=Anaerocolumna cellulosilytica TaxID=433286 RepID=A0A6S6R535_9FIRM|nr:acyl carrier protein [Anaerocolumna cellulosilytica]MBB5194869.1 acyl carrier protein [Anaerocolumna cellulosilytica]BCJ94168.1 hypothetical protein acsn021_17370 [Anaerocolumna cellulosilytica]